MQKTNLLSAKKQRKASKKRWRPISPNIPTFEVELKALEEKEKQESPEVQRERIRRPFKVTTI